MTSKRKTAVEAVLRELEHRTFAVIEGYDRYTVLETPRLEAVPTDNEEIAMSTFFREDFRDKSTAIFCANVKRSEAIVDAILKIYGVTK